MPNGNQLARFTYNQRLELVKSKRERGGCAPPEVHTYAYDLNHNRIEADGVNYSNNLADQLLSVGAGGSLTYNDAGQAQNVQGWDVTYNCADQITGIQMPGKSIAYRYDGAGQRVQKTVNGVTQKFLWNGGDIAKEYNADDSVKADYFLGAGREGIKTDGQWHYYLSDIQGSTLMLTDSSGNSAATYDYSDFGETRQTSGSTSLYNPFLYTGQEYDFETSLYHLRARHYSPGLGRFFARDPIGYAGGSNMYAYCAGDPIGCIDPSGLNPLTVLSVSPLEVAPFFPHGEIAFLAELKAFASPSTQLKGLTRVVFDLEIGNFTESCLRVQVKIFERLSGVGGGTGLNPSDSQSIDAEFTYQPLGGTGMFSGVMRSLGGSMVSSTSAKQVTFFTGIKPKELGFRFTATVSGTVRGKPYVWTLESNVSGGEGSFEI